MRVECCSGLAQGFCLWGILTQRTAANEELEEDWRRRARRNDTALTNSSFFTESHKAWVFTARHVAGPNKE